MKRVVALGMLAACAFAAADARATAAVLFAGDANAKVDRHRITAAFSTTGAVTWDAIDVTGSPTDIGLVVAVKAGGRVEITEPAWVEAAERATRVVVRTLGEGVTCTAVGIGGGVGVDFDGGVKLPSGSVNGSGSGGGGCGGSSGGSSGGSTNGSGSGGCGGSGSSSSEGSGGCLTSSQGGCGSCDNGGCDPTHHGHPGCSAIHGCAPAADDDFSPSSSPRDSGATDRVGPYETTRLRANDGSAAAWLALHGYVAPAGFVDGILALEADGYEVRGFRARAPAAPSIVRSLRVVTTSPSSTLPLRLVRMSTGADAAATPVTLIALSSAAQSLVDQPLVAIDETRLTRSNYESLVSEALGAPASDAGADAGTRETRWVLESSRALVARTSDAGADGGGAAVTLGDFFRETCGARRPQAHSVCAVEADDPIDGGGASDAGDVDAGEPTDGGIDAGAVDAGTADAGASCTDVARERCDDLALALPTGTSVATRFRGVVGGSAALVGDLAFAASTGPLREARFTVRANGEAGLCAAVDDDGSVTGGVGAEAGAGAACKAVRSRYRIDLGPIVMLAIVIRALSFIMRRRRR